MTKYCAIVTPVHWLNIPKDKWMEYLNDKEVTNRELKIKCSNATAANKTLGKESSNLENEH